MDKLKKLQDAKAAKLAEMNRLIEAAADGVLSADQQKQFEALEKAVAAIDASISAAEKSMKIEAELAEAKAKAKVPADMATPQENIVDEPKKISVPATAKRFGAGSLKAFKTAEDAYTAGMWLGASLGNKKAQQWCNDHGVSLEAVSQGSNNANGGYLVPEVLSSSIIELVVQYGVFRRNAGVIPMTSDTLMIPRRSGGLTAYYVGDDQAITEGTKTWDLVRLIAKDLGVITRVSNDLTGDAVIPIMDNLTAEMARALAYAEDMAGFLGDGTGTYGGISGLLTRMVANHWTAPSVNSGSGLVEWGTGTDHENITMANMTSLMALLPSYARANAKWFCSPAFQDAVMTRLTASAGGVPGYEIRNGVISNKFLGYPVELVEVMPVVGTDQKISAYFGDLSLAAKFGDRQQITIAASDSASVGGYSVFERNQIALRAVERFDINVHDIGVSGTPGAIVGLMCYDAA